MAVFDASAVLYLFDDEAASPLDPTTACPVTQAKERIDYPLQRLEENGETLVIPTPTLSQILMISDQEGQSLLDEMKSYSSFRGAPFDERSAIVPADLTRRDKGANDLRAGTSETRAKLKFDRQIIAITLTLKESTIYSDDLGLAKVARRLEVEVIHTYQLPLPPWQEPLFPRFAGQQPSAIE